MTKLISKFKISKFNFFFHNFPNLFNLSFWKLKIIVLAFSIIYSIFLIGTVIVSYKVYQFAMNDLSQIIYGDMAKDLIKLNYNHPMKYHMRDIPLIEETNLLYNKLGIIDYKDYIYNLSGNSQYMNSLFLQNPVLESKVSCVILSDMIKHNIQLIADLSEEVVKRIFRLTLPLYISTLLLGFVFIAEKTNLLNQAIAA